MFVVERSGVFLDFEVIFFNDIVKKMCKNGLFLVVNILIFGIG